MNKLLPFLIILIALIAAIAGAAWYVKKSGNATMTAVGGVVPDPKSSPAAPGPAAPGPVEPGATPPNVQGPDGAPVTLEEFGDFQCPPCGLLDPVLKQMQGEFGSKLRIVFREFPLVPTHEHALAAARAAEAAGLQGKFWEMHDMLYENQKAWRDVFDVRPIFEGYATRIGLDLNRLRTDIGSDVVEKRIFLDGKRGHSLNVNGTPTVFINGREVPFESLAPEKLRVIIQKELNGK